MLEVKTYKNWKEICEAIGWKTTGGDYKKARISELETVCKYHKEGNKFVIEEVLSQPSTTPDSRQENYIPLIENLILNLCYGETHQLGFDGYIRVSMSSIARAVGLFNENFAQCKRMVGKTSKYLDTNIDTTKEYFDTVQRSACGKIETALKNLHKKATVSWSKITMIAEIEDCEYLSEVEQKNGETKIVKNTMEKHRKATDEEIDFIRDIRKKIYINYGVEDAKQAKFSKEAKLINKEIRTELLKNNISYYYDAYEIRFNPEFVEYDLRKFNLSYEEKEAMRKTLKDEFSIKIYENADKKMLRVWADHIVLIRRAIDGVVNI